MDDGLYRLRFNAAGTNVDGSLEVKRDTCIGQDPLREMRGEFSRAGNSLLATLDVTCAPGAEPPIGGARTYTLKMFGSGTDNGFNVIGVGPLGMIVEITGEWQAPLTQARS